MDRIIFHIDVNNAFLSWTAVDMLRNGSNVDIRKIPSVISGDEKLRHGVVVAKSPIAKNMGVKSAEPLFIARKKCPNLKVYRSNMQLYKRESDKLYRFFLQLTPDVERYSIDECFLDFTGTNYLYDDYLKLANQIRTYVNDNFGITINIGIANNKLCAKMASDFSKPNKIHTLFNNEIQKKMWPLPVDDLFMVGKSSAKILHELGINTIGQLAKSDLQILSKYFKNNTQVMIDHANGIDNEVVNSKRTKEKSISVSETFSEDIDNLEDLNKILLYQSDSVGRELRKRKKYTSVIAVTLKTSDFKNYSHQRKLSNPTNITEEIYKISCDILKNCFRGTPVRLIGIRLDSLANENIKQISIFDNKKNENVEKLQNLMDNINEKYGNLKIMPASMKNNSKK